MNTRSCLLAGLAFVLAGCADAEPAAPASTEMTDDPAGAMGNLRGLVIDDALVPVSGANVTLSTVERTVRTNVDGSFLFDNVPVGEHTLVVEASGIASVSKDVTIAEGETAYVEVSVEHVRSEVGYYVTKVGRGILACGATYRQGFTTAIGPFLGGGCNVINATGLDVSTYFTWLSDNLSAWRGGAAETEWTSTQAFGNGLVQDWAVIGCANNRNATFGRDTGPSPLRNLLGSFELDYRLQDLPNSSCEGHERCNDEGCHMINRIFSWPSTQPEEAPVDVGITLQQTFTTYISEFFRQEPPQDFTALLDS